MSRGTLSDAELRWAHRRWCEGYSLAEIGDALFVSASALGDAFRRHGLVRERRPISYKTPTRAEVLREMDNIRLADALLDMHNGAGFCRNLPECRGNILRVRCMKCMLAWLEEAVER
ncbi:MAG: hypothetical protein IJ960_00805 [Oscillospiraceae bacterium]|nr:hypothetical protein [Oscillospiraceae bacterium]